MKTVFTFICLLCFACGGSKPEATAASTTSSAARPTCDAIDRACDPHEDKGGLAKECHDFSESSATTEATCVARKAECMAACPAKH
jgi:hypothetical protein